MTLMAMHCSQKTFHLLSVFNGPTSIFSDISIALRITQETILRDIFEQSQIPSRYFFEMYQRRHRIDIFFETGLRRLKDITV